MEKVYANLLGEWVDLSEDPNAKIGIHRSSPRSWWDEGAPIFSPFKKDNEDTLYELDYVHIHFKGKDYRINPIFIQIVTE